jgi:hypothetical protein
MLRFKYCTTLHFWLIFPALIFSSLHSFGQFANIRIDERSATDLYVCEPAVAINPRNTNNIVAASILDNIYTTLDAGKTWTKTKLKSPYGVYGDPAIIADRKGTFYTFHLSDPTLGKGGYDSEKLDRFVVHQSTDGGVTWNESGFAGLNSPKDQDKEWPAVDSKGNLYLTWTEFDKYGDSTRQCNSRILFSKSRTGSRWSTPVQLSQTPGNCLDDDNTAEGATTAISSDGKVFAAWSNQGKIFLDRSYDGGTTWLNNDIVVAQQHGGWDIVIPGHDRSNGLPVLVCDHSPTTASGNLYLVWADTKNGDKNSDVWFTSSSDAGDHWSTPLKVNNDRTSTHQYLPWMTVDQTTGYIYVVFYDRRNYEDNQTDVYLAYSTNAGRSFTNVRISEASFIPEAHSFFGDYTNISATGGVVVPVWARMDNGMTSIWTSIIKQEELIKEKN